MALLLLSVGVNVLQAHKIRTLVLSNRPAVSLIGRAVPSISGATLDRQPVTIALQGRVPTVIYHFSSSCGWCDRNWANVEVVVAAARGRYRVIAVSTEQGLKAYVEQRGLSVEVIEELSQDAERLLNLSGTPTTITVGADGIVTHEWAGAYTARVARQVEELFGVNLPGLMPPAPLAEER